MTFAERSELMALLRALDDPVHLEHPAGFHYRDEQRRFDRLVADLERVFGFVGDVHAGANVQDASYLGQVAVPGSATILGTAIFVRVSNFGRLALVGAEGPGRYDDAETLALIAEADRAKLLAVLADHGYVALLEDVLAGEYDGVSDALRQAYPSYPPTWFVRFFDYL